MKHGQLLINGQWVAGVATMTSRNPATGEVLGRVYKASSAEVGAAVAAARKALSVWSEMSLEQRSAILLNAVAIFASATARGAIYSIEKCDHSEMGSFFLKQTLEV